MTLSLRRLGLVAGAVLALLLLLAGGLVAFVHAPAGERLLARQAKAAIPHLALDGLEVSWPFTVSAAELRLSDPRGTWLRIERPLLEWRPLRLIRNVVAIDRLAADRVVVERLPDLPAPAAEDQQADGFDPFSLRLDLDRLTAPIVLEMPELGERVLLDLSGTFRMGTGHAGAAGGMVDVHLRAQDGGIARLAGTAGRDFLDLRWYLTVPRMERWDRLVGVDLAGRLSASGLVAGRLPQPVLTARLDVGSGHAAGLSWRALEATARAVPGDDAWRIAVTGAAREPAAEGVSAPTLALDAALDLAPEAEQIRLGRLRLETGGITVSARGVVDGWGRDANLVLDADAVDLARLQPLTGLDWRGAAGLRLHLGGDLLAPDLRAVASLDTRALDTGIAVLDRLLGPSPRMRAVLRMAGAGLPELVSATIDGAGADAVLQGAVFPQLDLRVRLAVPDLAVFADTLAGAGVARGRVRGPPADPAAWGVAEVAGLAAAGSPPADGAVGFDFAGLGTTPTGMVTAGLAVAGRPVQGRARLVVGEPVLIQDLAVASGDSRVSGDLMVEEAGLRGRLAGRIPRLDVWDVGLRGSLEVKATLDPAAGQSVAIQARARGLEGEGVTARLAEASATLRQVETRPRGQVRPAALGVAAGGLALDRLDARAEGSPERFRFQVDGEGQGGARAAAAGSAWWEGSRGTAILDRLRLAAGGVEARLAEPTRLRWGPDGVRADRTVLAVGGGRVVGEGGLAGDRLAVRLEVSDLPLDLMEVALPDLQAVGTVDGTLSVGGTVADPTARASLRGSRLGFVAAAQAGVGRLSATLDATWENGRLEARATAEDPPRLRLEASGVVPLRLGDGDMLPATAPLVGQFSVAGDLGRLTDALPLAGHAFAGRVEGSGQVAGTVGEPRLDGRFTLGDGRYENLDSGTVLAGLSALAVLDGDRIRIEAGGSDGGAGTARLDGAVSLGGDAPSWRGTVALDRFRALRRDDVRAVVSARLDTAGEGGEGRIAGDATVTRAEVDVARLQGGGPVRLEVVEINKPGGDAPPEPEAEEGGAAGPLTIRLAINLGIERAFVRGRGLESIWEGRVAVAGTLSAPRLTGRLVAARGRYDLLGRPFRLAEGSAVIFDGGDEIDPALDIAAEASAGEVTARVQVAGRASNPILTMSSQPPLPQDEVLSRVLFGTEAGQLSAFQQIQLAQMAASGLSGRGDGFDPIGGVRGLLGLDVLEVGAAEEDEGGGPTVSAGKYIDEDTFLRLEQGTQGAGRVTVERKLGGGFSVTSEVGQESGGGVGLEWRRDY